MFRSALRAIRCFSSSSSATQECSAAQLAEAVVVGSGVAGLAVARELGHRGLEVVILESAADFGTGTSSRSSEVIHSGIYYPTGSSKATHCVAGAGQIYEYCASRNIPHKRLSKLVVATSEDEVGQLLALQQNAQQNDVSGTKLLDAAESQQLEPNLRCRAALYVPSTGIVDSHSYMLALLADAEATGAALALQSTLVAGNIQGDHKVLEVRDDTDGSISFIACRILVNCAGLSAQSVARSLTGMPPSKIPPLHLARGHYFTSQGQSPFKRLIYPLPEAGGLGVHLTLDMAGQARFGPDVQWVAAEDYTIPQGRDREFYASIRKYYPALQDGALQPGYAGIRPKISGPGQPAADFLVQGPADHGIQGLVNMFGIEPHKKIKIMSRYVRSRLD